MKGHLEAGQIEFRAETDGELVFSIESWASSGDLLSKIMYQHLRMAKEVQLHMWTSFLERVARLGGGRLRGGIDVDTRRVATDEGSTDDAGVKQALDALHDTGLNFEVAPSGNMTPEHGWRIDDYCEPLPGEPPGPPVTGGSWNVARRLMRDYEFADPSIVRAVYHADSPLEDREMLLEARFGGLRFHVGVRVGGVRDTAQVVDGRDVRIWGWNYRTLKGHLEMGQIDYEVWKWLDTGEVQFRVHAVSRPAEIPNPIVRLGFRVFGRREQVRFARNACERMRRLTIAALKQGDGAEDVPRAMEELRVGRRSD